MNDAEVYENIEIGFTVRQQPDAYPPNIKDVAAVFYIDRERGAPGIKAGHRLFQFVQTYRYPDGVELQVWEGAEGLYCSRVGQSEPLVYFGKDFYLMPHHRDIFVPISAEEHFADLVARKVDRYMYDDEIEWLNYLSKMADGIVRTRESNHQRATRNREISELA